MEGHHTISINDVLVGENRPAPKERPSSHYLIDFVAPIESNRIFVSSIASHFVLLHELFSTSADVVLNGPGSRCMDAVWTMKQPIFIISGSCFLVLLFLCSCRSMTAAGT